MCGCSAPWSVWKRLWTRVLNTLKDYVLCLKHNFNAQAVSSLRKEVADIETEVSSLIADMNRSIKEADAFVKTM